MRHPIAITFALVLALSACRKDELEPVFDPEDTAPDVAGNTPPSVHTAARNGRIAEQLPLSDQRDFEDARRGRIASDPALRVLGRDGRPIWDMLAYEFIDGEPPPSVNPSLWRQARLNNIHGLFEVTKGIYQLRGYDLANMTLIEGKTGWIVVDPLRA